VAPEQAETATRLPFHALVPALVQVQVLSHELVQGPGQRDQYGWRRRSWGGKAVSLDPYPGRLTAYVGLLPVGGRVYSCHQA